MIYTLVTKNSAEIDLPVDLHDFCELNHSIHEDLGRALDAVNLSYKAGKLTIVTASDISSKLSILREIHTKKLYEKMYLSFQLTEIKTGTKMDFKFPRAKFERINVTKPLMRMVIGRKGENIKKAKAISGISGKDFNVE